MSIIITTWEISPDKNFRGSYREAALRLVRFAITMHADSKYMA